DVGFPVGVRRICDSGRPLAVPHLGAYRSRRGSHRRVDAPRRCRDETRSLWLPARGDDSVSTWLGSMDDYSMRSWRVFLPGAALANPKHPMAPAPDWIQLMARRVRS